MDAVQATVDPQALLVVLQNSMSTDQALRTGAETQLQSVASSPGGYGKQSNGAHRIIRCVPPLGLLT